jgi:hypothetical protein
MPMKLTERIGNSGMDLEEAANCLINNIGSVSDVHFYHGLDKQPTRNTISLIFEQLSHVS